jgi:hypothetical protein
MLSGTQEGGGETRLLPTSYYVRFPLEIQDALPRAAGGFSEVWKANDSAGTTFALKVLRVTQEDDFSEIKKVWPLLLTSNQQYLM